MSLASKAVKYQRSNLTLVQKAGRCCDGMRQLKDCVSVMSLPLMGTEPVEKLTLTGIGKRHQRCTSVEWLLIDCMLVDAKLTIKT